MIPPPKLNRISLMKFLKPIYFLIALITLVFPLYLNAQQMVPNGQQLEPTFKDRPPPSYPRVQERSGRAGTVEVVLMVDEKGIPFDVVAVGSSHSSFEPTAVRAVERYVYEPFLLSGNPVQTRQRVLVYYEMAGRSATSVTPRFVAAYKRSLKQLAKSASDSEKSSISAMQSLLRPARSRCDHSLQALLRSDYSDAARANASVIASLRTAIMIDEGVSAEMRCMDESQFVSAKGRLIKALIDDQRYGDVVYEYRAAEALRLEKIVEVYADTVGAIFALQTTTDKVEKMITVPEAGVYVEELLSAQFSLAATSESDNKLSVHCEAGFHEFAVAPTNARYTVPPQLKHCRVVVRASPGTQFLFTQHWTAVED